jgi:hypothetical protein
MVTLDFFHDVAVNEVLSPALGRGERMFYAVDCSEHPSNSRFVWFYAENPREFYDIGKWPNNNFPGSATFIGNRMYFCDTDGTIFKKADPNLPDYESVGNGPGECLGLAYDPKGKTLYASSSSTLFEMDPENAAYSTIGGFGTGTIMISIDADNDGNLYGYDLGFGTAQTYSIDTFTGLATAIGPTGVQLNYGQDMAFDHTEEIMYACAFNYGTYAGEYHAIDLETGAFTYIAPLYQSHQTTCFATSYGCPCPALYISPGIQKIDVIVRNLGTFPEFDMTCYAEIYEYITNCSKGTLVYEDNITDIDIPKPLGGKEELNFNKFNFSQEGVYVLYLNLVDNDDDKLKNNKIYWDVYVDDTPPISNYNINPPYPDGDNEYYVNDIEITLSAVDQELPCSNPGSGVDYIEYRINGGDWQTIPGDAGTWTFGDDGNDIFIEYRAVDMAGHSEDINSFTINVDQTAPIAQEIDWKSYRYGGWWNIDLTAHAEDETAEMDRVEFFINDGLQEIIEGEGPDYVFTIQWSEVFRKHSFFFYHYDRAGNVILAFFDPDNVTAVIKSNMQQSSEPNVKMTYRLIN